MENSSRVIPKLPEIAGEVGLRKVTNSSGSRNGDNLVLRCTRFDLLGEFDDKDFAECFLETLGGGFSGVNEGSSSNEGILAEDRVLEPNASSATSLMRRCCYFKREPAEICRGEVLWERLSGRRLEDGYRAPSSSSITASKGHEYGGELLEIFNERKFFGRLDKTTSSIIPEREAVAPKLSLNL